MNLLDPELWLALSIIAVAFIFCVIDSNDDTDPPFYY